MLTSVAKIIQALGGQLQAGPAAVDAAQIERIAPLKTATHGSISFLSHARYAVQLAQTQASCVILAPDSLDAAKGYLARGGLCIVTPQPYLYYARLSQWWRSQLPQEHASGIHASAVVHATAQVHASAVIGPLCVIGAHASIGANTRLTARVSVGERCEIGDRCILHPGVVIGTDGFGFAPREDKSWEKIEQLGAVRIGNDVEIGANTCIDRGALDDTVIEDGVKLDNLIQIGHNVRVGKHTAMAGNAGVAGSASIGAYCTVGGGAVILGHLEIADHVHISASTTVTRSISEPGIYTGMFPIDTNKQWEKNAVSLRQLHALRDRIRELEKKIQES